MKVPLTAVASDGYNQTGIIGLWSPSLVDQRKVRDVNELIPELIGALVITGACTRLARIVLRPIEEPTKSFLVALLVGLLSLLIASQTMGPPEAFLVYVPSVGAWLVFDLYRAFKTKTPFGTTESASQMKKCPQCAEFVRHEAKICRYCRYEFPPMDEGSSKV